MSATEFDTLVEDIRGRGLIEPIKLLDGAIYDGRHRYWAITILGINPDLCVELVAPTENFDPMLMRFHATQCAAT